MNDYIDREDAIKAFDPLQRRDWYTPWIVETLEDLPLADVAPIQHGRWRSGVCSKCGGIKPMTKVEYCGSIIWEARHKLNYCPNCGARMDGEYKNCGTCKHHDKWWDEIICDGCTKAHSNWERRDDE